MSKGMYCYDSKEISDLVEISINLSKSLDNLECLEREGLVKWAKKYKVLKYYNKARKFLAIPEIREMFKEVEGIYKEAFKEKWKEELNEENK